MNYKNRILVVEDDEVINGLLVELLTSNGYEVQSAYSGTEAKLRLDLEEYQMVLLDLMLPGITGEKLIKEIRKVKIMPVIVISAKIATETKVEVLRIGADDFISKPFDNDEVLARIEAQLRRYQVFSHEEDKVRLLQYKDLVLDTEACVASINYKQLDLTAREYKILKELIMHPKKVYTRAQLFETVWEDTYMGDDNTINVHISNIRSKLNKLNPREEYIETIWGIGFKMKSLD
ncbi:MAG: response regulator transcription factor [Cellulosilyticum sp.]|nr:response regulator transcription factor [Cellulosilyticum sp.]